MERAPDWQCASAACDVMWKVTWREVIDGLNLGFKLRGINGTLLVFAGAFSQQWTLRLG